MMSLARFLSAAMSSALLPRSLKEIEDCMMIFAAAVSLLRSRATVFPSPWTMKPMSLTSPGVASISGCITTVSTPHTGTASTSTVGTKPSPSTCTREPPAICPTLRPPRSDPSLCSSLAVSPCGMIGNAWTRMPLGTPVGVLDTLEAVTARPAITASAASSAVISGVTTLVARVLAAMYCGAVAAPRGRSFPTFRPCRSHRAASAAAPPAAGACHATSCSMLSSYVVGSSSPSTSGSSSGSYTIAASVPPQTPVAPRYASASAASALNPSTVSTDRHRPSGPNSAFNPPMRTSTGG
mmetsp:Transcript_26002/g.65116  ORF Transcript_26002/g.65116 Transcript_26002/m.65116 type:complete len:296 (+) Transcript_26002:924-1811(+)